jgi:hypothetical protein
MRREPTTTCRQQRVIIKRKPAFMVQDGSELYVFGGRQIAATKPSSQFEIRWLSGPKVSLW